MTSRSRRDSDRSPHPLLEEVRENLQDMLDRGAIRPSKSPRCNTIVLVRKKDRTLRFCIDFRKLNARTKKYSFPLPRMQETMESIVGARFFSSMDLKSGFWQVRMSEKSRQYTAFTVGSLGVYEFLRMPYGLCNAPAMFQRLMQNCLGELNLTYALVYLDDVIVYSKTEEDHLRRLQAIFEWFHEYGLKLKPSKCSFLRKQITFFRARGLCRWHDAWQPQLERNCRDGPTGKLHGSVAFSQNDWIFPEVH